MKRLLLPLLAANAFPAASYATNFVECDAIFNAYYRIQKAFLKADEAYLVFKKDSPIQDPDVLGTLKADRQYELERFKKISDIAKKRNCRWTF